MIDRLTLLTILLMAFTTYLTRIVGYLALRQRTLSPRLRRVMQSVPGCVLIAMIAPAFASDQPANLLGLAVTIFVAMRMSILPTVMISVMATAMFRYLLG